MSIFYSDDSWQKHIRNKTLKPFYQQIAFESRFIFVDKGSLADVLQRQMAIDTVLQGSYGKVTSIEEKIVRWPGYKYDKFTLEINSCTNPGFEKLGWMHYAKCDILLYCFHQRNWDIEAYSIPFKPLQEWFFADFKRYYGYSSTFTEQYNHTECKLVPIADVCKNVKGVELFLIKKNGEFTR